MAQLSFCPCEFICKLRTVMLLATIAVSGSAQGQLYINELFFDPPGAGDARYEYVELRGEPNAPLDDYYLIFIENEDNAAFNGPAGQIDHIFDLGIHSLGSNGFITFRQKNPFAAYPVNPAANNLANSGSGSGFGSGPTSSIGSTDSGSGVDPTLGQIENGGFTAAIIRNVSGSAPVIDFDLDVGNNGLDITPEANDGWWGQIGWELIDAVGVHSEFESDFGRLYAPVNFGFDQPVPFGTAPRVPDGAEYVAVGFEIEFAARWGNSTGQTSDDWHITNVTDNAASGFIGPNDFRQSRPDPHAFDDMDPSTPPEQNGTSESSKGVLYGTPLTTTLGGPNYITGDFNGDGYVDAADYTVWRDSLGMVGTSTNLLAADANLDYVVDGADYLIWRSNFGAPVTAASGSGSLGGGNTATVPEPSSLAILALALIAGLAKTTTARRL